MAGLGIHHHHYNSNDLYEDDGGGSDYSSGHEQNDDSNPFGGYSLQAKSSAPSAKQKPAQSAIPPDRSPMDWDEENETVLCTPGKGPKTPEMFAAYSIGSGAKKNIAQEAPGRSFKGRLQDSRAQKGQMSESAYSRPSSNYPSDDRGGPPVSQRPERSQPQRKTYDSKQIKRALPVSSMVTVEASNGAGVVDTNVDINLPAHLWKARPSVVPSMLDPKTIAQLRVPPRNAIPDALQAALDKEPRSQEVPPLPTQKTAVASSQPAKPMKKSRRASIGEALFGKKPLDQQPASKQNYLEEPRQAPQPPASPALSFRGKNFGSPHDRNKSQFSKIKPTKPMSRPSSPRFTFPITSANAALPYEYSTPPQKSSTGKLESQSASTGMSRSKSGGFGLSGLFGRKKEKSHSSKKSETPTSHVVAGYVRDGRSQIEAAPAHTPTYDIALPASSRNDRSNYSGGEAEPATHKRVQAGRSANQAPAYTLSSYFDIPSDNPTNQEYIDDHEETKPLRTSKDRSDQVQHQRSQPRPRQDNGGDKASNYSRELTRSSTNPTSFRGSQRDSEGYIDSRDPHHRGPEHSSGHSRDSSASHHSNQQQGRLRNKGEDISNRSRYPDEQKIGHSRDSSASHHSSHQYNQDRQRKDEQDQRPRYRDEPYSGHSRDSSSSQNQHPYSNSHSQQIRSSRVNDSSNNRSRYADEPKARFAEPYSDHSRQSSTSFNDRREIANGKQQQNGSKLDSRYAKEDQSLKRTDYRYTHSRESSHSGNSQSHPYASSASPKRPANRLDSKVNQNDRRDNYQHQQQSRPLRRDTDAREDNASSTRPAHVSAIPTSNHSRRPKTPEVPFNRNGFNAKPQHLASKVAAASKALEEADDDDDDDGGEADYQLPASYRPVHRLSAQFTRASDRATLQAASNIIANEAASKKPHNTPSPLSSSHQKSPTLTNSTKFNEDHDDEQEEVVQPPSPSHSQTPSTQSSSPVAQDFGNPFAGYGAKLSNSNARSNKNVNGNGRQQQKGDVDSEEEDARFAFNRQASAVGKGDDDESPFRRD